ncbi:hypothetical protein EJ110_NYTH42853 [Nymphaea thermarum]|nr:hypothetical protein EJ110_NYTH42853 [Nymphaea thermarum]
MGPSNKASGNLSNLLSVLCSLGLGRISPQISLLRKDSLVRVSNEDELNLVLKRREWRIGGKVLVAQSWVPGMQMEINPQLIVPLCMRLLSLAPYFWSNRIFPSRCYGFEGRIFGHQLRHKIHGMDKLCADPLRATPLESTPTRGQDRFGSQESLQEYLPEGTKVEVSELDGVQP